MEIFNNNSIVNLSNSIIRHFGGEVFHETIPEIDKLLEGHDKVAVLLFDGMGKNIVRKHLKEDSFIRSHYVTTINSTFPPTTVASTNAFLSGKYPIETGWLAWCQRFKEFDANLILFTNMDYNRDEQIEDGRGTIARRELPYTSIFENIKSHNNECDVYDIKKYPISLDGPEKLWDGVEIVNSRLHKSKNCFLYFYFDTPDYQMHELGIDHKDITYHCNDVDKFVKKLCEDNKDTIFICIADHGHVNCKYLDICEHEDLYNLLDWKVSLEKRSPTFFVKPNSQHMFEVLFDKYYGDKFELVTHEWIFKHNLYGIGNIHPRAEEFVGDFMAISKSEYALYASKEMLNMDFFPGHHAGGTKEEREIDVSVFNA